MHIPIDGGRLHYTDAGAGETLILLHGFPLDGRSWQTQAAELSRSYRVICPDLRGSGQSSVTPGPYLMESLAGDILDLMDALHVERAAFAAPSIGSYVQAAFFRMYSERVSGFALVAGNTFADTQKIYAGRGPLADRAEREGMQPVIDAYLPRYYAPHFYAERPDLIEEGRRWMSEQSAAGVAAQIRGMAERVTADDLLEDILVPSLVLAPSDDSWIPVAHLRAVADQLADCEFLEVAACGHMPMREHPAIVTAALARLMERVSAATT